MPDSLGRSRGSTLLPLPHGKLLSPSIPKLQRRSDEQRDEEPVHDQDPQDSRRAPRAQPEHQLDRGDQRLSERRRQQRACHFVRPEARDDGTDDPHGEHPAIHQVGGVARIPDDADGKVYPDEDERRRERDADGESVRDIARLPRYQLIRETAAEDEGTGDDEIGQGPGSFR
jgi:hypothetical protein